MATIVINGKTYDSDILTKEARDKILMAQVFDKRINELKNDQVMAQIALNTVVLELGGGGPRAPMTPRRRRSVRSATGS